MWKDYPPFKEIACNKKLASIAVQLIGSSSIRLFQDQILIKDSESARPTPWHRDMTIWPMYEKSALTVRIALDDVDAHNGCMQFVPASHRKTEIMVQDIWEPRQIVTGIKPDIMKMKAGSIHFHNCLTLHCTFGNNSSFPRRAYAIVYIPDSTIYNGLSYHLTDKVGFSIGQVIAGESFPKLI